MTDDPLLLAALVLLVVIVAALAFADPRPCAWCGRLVRPLDQVRHYNEHHRQERP